MTEDYKIGYGNPPKHSQFKPGETGNRKGRPRGKKSFLAELDEALSKKVIIKENGKETVSTKRQVILTQLVNKACRGDAKATEQVITHLKQRDRKIEEKEAQEDLTETDDAIFYRFTEHYKREGLIEAGVITRETIRDVQIYGESKEN